MSTFYELSLIEILIEQQLVDNAFYKFRYRNKKIPLQWYTKWGTDNRYR